MEEGGLGRATAGAVSAERVESILDSLHVERRKVIVGPAVHLANSLVELKVLARFAGRKDHIRQMFQGDPIHLLELIVRDRECGLEIGEGAKQELECDSEFVEAGVDGLENLFADDYVASVVTACCPETQSIWS